MFRIILLCLITCCSSFMPLKQSESIISEDHTQVVERKHKSNYYSEDRFDVKYSFNSLLSDVYWLNLYNDLINNPNSIFLGGTSNVSYYDIINNNASWTASSTSLSSCRFYYIFNNEIYQVSSNEYYFTSIVLNSTNTMGGTQFTLTLDIVVNNNNTGCTIKAFIDSDNSFIGSVLVPYSNFWSYFVGTRDIISFPKSAFGLAVSAESTLDYDDGYYNGYNNGYIDGYNNRQVHYDDEVYQNGYDTGYTAGVAHGISETLAGGTEAMTIFAGIMDVAFIPVNVFFLMFDYEVFGINIAGFVSGLLTLAIVIILMRFIFGRRV